MAFDLLAWVASPHQDFAVHNVTLLEVVRGEGGYEDYVIELDGTKHVVPGGGKHGDFSTRKVGKVGFLRGSTNPGERRKACYFQEYVDQSLRRHPVATCRMERSRSVGVVVAHDMWTCDAKPDGCWVPAGLIPGMHGNFVPDETEAVTIRVPPEFIEQCNLVEMTPEALLKSFVGDLAGVQSYVDNPRADGFGSNGSDERDFAEQWLNRAHGMQRVSWDQIQARQEAARESVERSDALENLMCDYEENGGKPEDLLALMAAAVQKLTGR